MRNLVWKYQLINTSGLLFYGQREIILYDIDEYINDDISIYKGVIEPEHRILCVSYGWSYNRHWIYCKHSKTNQPKIFTFSAAKSVLDSGIECNHVIKSISSGEYHQIFVCNNGYCYGLGSNIACQLGLDAKIREINELKLIATSVNASVCMPFGTFIQKTNGIYSCGNNSFACIGHLCSMWTTGLDTVNTLTLINFTRDMNITTVNAGHGYSVFVSKHKEYFFLGDSKPLLWLDHKQPLRLLESEEIIQCYTGYDEIFLIIQLKSGELGFYTFGPNIFNNHQRHSWVLLKKIFERTGSTMPIIDIAVIDKHFGGTELLIIQST